MRFNVDVKEPEAAEAGSSARTPHRVLLTSFSDQTRRRAVQSAVRSARSSPAVSPGGRTIALLRVAAAIRSIPLARGALHGVDAVQIPERFGAVRVLPPPGSPAHHARTRGRGPYLDRERPRRIRSLVAAGVDGIITDRADLAIAALRRG